MNKLKSIVITLLGLVLSNQSINGQSGGANFCDLSEPLCASNEFSYSNTFAAGNAEFGPDYGCLLEQPNPAWFYLQIEESGSLTLLIEQSTVLGGPPNLDVDFIIYGPFSDPSSACSTQLTAANTIGCSYLPDNIELVEISNALAGEYYILLITNFSDQPGFISVIQTTGTGATNCGIIADEYACEGDIVTLNATTAFATNYVWYEDDGFGIDNFLVINGFTTATYDVLTSNLYKAEAYDDLNNLLETFEYNVLFFESPNIPLVIQDYIICDNLDDNDGIGQFDLSTKDSEILNGLNPSVFSVSYYGSIYDANAGVNQLPLMYNNSLLAEIIIVRVDNITTNKVECFDINSFNIAVNLFPDFELDEDYILCVDTNGTEEIIGPPIIETALDILNYSFVWSVDGNVLPLETGSSIIPTQAGIYEVEVSNLNSNCTIIDSAIVKISSPPVVTATIDSYAFYDDNVIRVVVSGTGVNEYEFSLDNGPWQENDRFNNVSPGKHTVTARDINGCGIGMDSVIVMDYPLFFTPNGDGLHDTWNIPGLANQLEAKIFIYDRYGKLLKQLSPKGLGWDGTFNGQVLPTSDYWFTVEFIEPKDGTLNLFKANFTLKQ